MNFIYLFNKYRYRIFSTCYILPVFSSSEYSLFHNSNLFGSCIIHILYTGCVKMKKIIPTPKGCVFLSFSHSSSLPPPFISMKYFERNFRQYRRFLGLPSVFRYGARVSLSPRDMTVLQSPASWRVASRLWFGTWRCSAATSAVGRTGDVAHTPCGNAECRLFTFRRIAGQTQHQ